MPDYSTLGEAAEADPAIRGILLADGPPTAAAAQIGRAGFVTSKQSVRRWRSRHLQADTLASPYPAGHSPIPARTRPRPQPPHWSPGISIVNGVAEVRTAFVSAGDGSAGLSGDHRRLLEDAGLTADEWTITRISPLVRKDETGSEMTAYWFRATPATDGPALSRADVDDILTQYPALVSRPQAVADRIIMIPSGDLQLGKAREQGGGTEATVERFARYTQEVGAVLEDSGPVKLLILPWLGDCIEGLVSQHGKNIASLDRTISEQLTIYARLMMHQIITLAPFAENIVVPVVPGNHDQTTREQNMPHTDSWAIAGASWAADHFIGRPGYAHLTWSFPPPGEPHLALDVGSDEHPLRLGFTHGHVTGGNPSKVIDWWKSQAHGGEPIGQADILVTGHWHHLRTEFTGGGKTWLQIPAMDGGSGWYRHRTGNNVPSGQVMLELTPGRGCGWTNLQVFS